MKKILFCFVFIVLFSLIILKYEKLEKKQLIFIVTDGVNVEQFNKLLSENNLPNFQKLISESGTSTNAVITGHQVTETAPGNAELHTGLKSDVTKIFKNGCDQILPENTTLFERLKNFDSKIITGSIYGKETCYIPLTMLQNAKNKIDWWHDQNSYTQNLYKKTACTDSTDILQKTTEFLEINKDNSFYLFVYLGVPDCVGHASGIPSEEYANSIINIDESLNILITKLETFSDKPKVIISGDHGWEPNTKGHSKKTKNTFEIILLSNDSDLIGTKSFKAQCDIAPTILNYFGVPDYNWEDITTNGCLPLNQNLQNSFKGFLFD